jgi:hypothetical protein
MLMIRITKTIQEGGDLVNWDVLPFDEARLRAYLVSLYKDQVQVVAVRELLDEDKERLKEFGYGTPLLIEFTHDGQAEQVVLHTMSEDGFGHERPSDRARNLLLDHATFNKLPRHVPSLDVGAFTPASELLSLGQAEEFFNLTEYAPGRPYARDLQQIAATGELSPGDEERAIALADYLAEIHALKQPDPVLYRRHIRDLLGHGEGIMGMLDGYPTDFSPAPPARLEEIEKCCVAWRWRIKGSSHRLSQVHGDFHPWNVLFQEGNEFVLLDRSRGEWGEPADDVSAMSINYILFSLRRHGTVSGPFRRLYDLFWERYLEQTGDQEVLTVIQPFYAWRALVVAHPIWYPSLPVPVREALFRFVENVLATDRFAPQRVNDYLEETC